MFISNICVLIWNICVRNVVLQWKTHGWEHTNFKRVIIFVISNICVRKRCFAVKNTRVRAHKLLRMPIFVNFEHLCEKMLFCSEKQEGESTQSSAFCLFQPNLCDWHSKLTLCCSKKLCAEKMGISKLFSSKSVQNGNSTKWEFVSQILNISS